MSTQVQTKAGTVKFLQFHQPALTSGDYEISVKQTINIPGSEVKFEATKNFTVAGERFELNPMDILGVFPPDGNLGDYVNVLPHLILNRSTLPWERRAEASASNIPWLALLLFDEDQKPKSQTMTLKKLLERSAGSPKFPELTREKGQHDDDKVTVIDVPQSVLETIMPSAEDLTLLTHVRFGVDAQDEGELAVIISNRIPQPGKISTAYLVSVESRFKQSSSGQNKYEFDYDRAAPTDLIRLVSLKSWSFTCEDPKKNLRELLLGLNKSQAAQSTLRLPRGAETAEKFFSRGYVLLEHHFRHGDQTASWFHGPLIPGRNTSSPEIDLPARCADELLRYDIAFSMFDISYAAAWELGRRLALQDKAVSTSLYRWKRRRAQARAQETQRVNHLPFQRSTPVDLPADVTSWFQNLRKLKGVPFNYLVPDEQMLPPESIRFFRIDRAWIDCLADGAFSIGRTTRSEETADRVQGRTPAADTEKNFSGFLLRSEVVSGWPGILVDAYSDRDAKQPRLTSVRMERLSAGVLLCIFEGDIARVDIHQKPETLHFGFVADTKTGGFFKKLRDPKTGDPLEAKVVLKPEHWRTDSPRTLKVTTLVDSMKTELKLTSAASALFALQMVEMVDKVIFLGKADGPT